jgi:membrane protein YdbS with pleckstrin-like domain
MKIGFMGLLTLVFITLKLTGYINWSWWLVLLPMIISISFAVILLVLHVILNILDPLWKYRK